MPEALARVVAALSDPFVDPASRTWWPSLLLAAAVAGGVAVARRGRLRLADVLPWRLWRQPSSVLDVQLFATRRLLALLLPLGGGAGATALGITLVRTLDAWVGVPEVPHPPAWALALGVGLVTFVASDASRYVLHRLLHQVPALWELHQVHHAAEVLTPLTLYRVHPIEGLLYGLRGTVVLGTVGGLAYWLFRADSTGFTVLGVTGIGFVLNGLLGNLRHSHVPWGFGRLERWLLSPAQHQVHHAREVEGHGRNYGVWLACWDRWGGTWAPSTGTVPAFGLPAAGRNHDPDDLVGALVNPVLAALRRVGSPACVAMAVGAAAHIGEARADDDAEDTDDTDDELAGAEIVVVGEGGMPRVAGSAAVIGEEELDRYAYDDIHRILARVPGVYVRNEDGFGLRPNIGIRGANSDRSSKIALMEDGILLVPAPYAAPAAYYWPLQQRIVGVEVFKGPAATRFGPNTVGGAINLITRPVPRDGLAVGLDAAAGMYGTFRIHGFTGYGNRKAGILLEAAHLGSSGFKQLDTGGPTGFDRQDVMLKARAATGGTVEHAVELKLGYGRELSNETYLGLTPNDLEATPYRRYAASALDRMRWQRTQAQLTWTVEAPDIDVRTVAYHQWISRQWFKLNRFAEGPSLHDLLGVDSQGQAGVYQAILRGDADSGSDDQLLRIGTNDRTFHAMGVQSVLHWSKSGRGWASRLEVGLRLHGDLADRLHTEDDHAMVDGFPVLVGNPRITTLDQTSDALAFAAHVHEDLLVGPVRILPGMRVEVIRTSAQPAGEPPQDPQVRAVPLPGLGLLVQTTPWLDLFAGVHRGFTPVAPGQPTEVQPETSWNVEAGGRASWRGVRGELVGFVNDYDNLAGVCTFSAGCVEDDLDRQFDAGRVLVAGMEAVAGHRHPVGGDVELAGEVTYTYTYGAFRTDFRSGFPQYGDVDTGDRLPYVPEHQGSLRLEMFHPRLTVSLAGNLRGPMRDAAGQGEIAPRALVPTALVWDLAVEVPVVRRVTLYGQIQNLADVVTLESFRPFGARPGAPFRAIAGVRVR